MAFAYPPFIVEQAATTNAAAGTVNTTVILAAPGANVAYRLAYVRLARRSPQTAGGVTIFIRDVTLALDYWVGGCLAGSGDGTIFPPPGLVFSINGAVSILDVGSAVSLPYTLVIGYYQDATQ